MLGWVHYTRDLVTNRMLEEDDQNGASNIRAQIEECQHQLIFLQKSQKSLYEAILEFPDDSDYIIAVEENNCVIEQKESRILNLRETLARTDMAYRAEKQVETIMLNRQSATAINLSIELSEDIGLFPIDEIGRIRVSNGILGVGRLAQSQSSPAAIVTAPVVCRSNLIDNNPSHGIYL